MSDDTPYPPFLAPPSSCPPPSTSPPWLSPPGVGDPPPPVPLACLPDVAFDHAAAERAAAGLEEAAAVVERTTWHLAAQELTGRWEGTAHRDHLEVLRARGDDQQQLAADLRDQAEACREAAARAIAAQEAREAAREHQRWLEDLFRTRGPR